MREAGKARRHGETDGEHGPGSADTKDHSEKQREQEAGECYGNVDEADNEPPGPTWEHRGGSAKQSSDRDANENCNDRKYNRKLGGDQNARENVATKRIRSEKVCSAWTLLCARGIDGLRLCTPDQWCKYCEQGDESDENHGGSTERAAGDGHPLLSSWHQDSRIVERGSSSASTISITRLTTRTPTP